MRKPAGTIAFILLLGLMASLPGFGVDMALPALANTAASLDVPTPSAGLTISSDMISFGIAPLIFGPVSDGWGRKPVVTFGCIIFVIAGIGCVLASSLPIFDNIPHHPGRRRGSHDARLGRPACGDPRDGRWQ